MQCKGVFKYYVTVFYEHLIIIVLHIQKSYLKIIKKTGMSGSSSLGFISIGRLMCPYREAHNGSVCAKPKRGKVRKKVRSDHFNIFILSYLTLLCLKLATQGGKRSDKKNKNKALWCISLNCLYIHTVCMLVILTPKIFTLRIKEFHTPVLAEIQYDGQPPSLSLSLSHSFFLFLFLNLYMPTYDQTL